MKKLVQIKSKKHRDQFTVSVKLAEARTIVAERDREKAERIQRAIERDQNKPQNYKVLSLSEENNRPSIFDQVDWGRAWDEYVRGQRSRAIIYSFGMDLQSEADRSMPC